MCFSFGLFLQKVCFSLQKNSFPRRIYFPTQNLLSHAEMGEDVIEGFLGCDFAAGDLSYVVEDLAQVFGYEVATEVLGE